MSNPKSAQSASVWKPATRRRVKLLALFAAAAVLIHWVVLGALPWTWAQRTPLPGARAASAAVSSEDSSAAPPVQVRVVTAEPAPEPVAAIAPVPVPGPAPVSAAATPAPAARKPTPAPVRPRDVATPVIRPVTPPAPAAPPAPTEAQAASEAQPGVTRLAQNVAAVAVSAPPSTPPGPATFPDETIPHYRTQAPPATLLRYDLQRGVLHGSGELLWRPDGGHYELRLDGRVGPLSVLTQVSSGGFDAAGLAPLRFTDKRLRRSAAATNFQREAGKITFSGPSAEFPLSAGMQDRLSWMVQLAAIVAAEPALRAPGARVLMGVVGVNADPAVWNFRGVGREAVETGAGTVVNALKFVRDPHDLHDTTVQVWLDPQRHYLPIHATQKSGPSDDEFSLRLLESSPVP